MHQMLLHLVQIPDCTGQYMTALHYTKPHVCYDWYTELHALQALNGGRRLVAHHPGVLGPQLHSFVLLALPSVEALRSTTTKIGMLLLQVITQ